MTQLGRKQVAILRTVHGGEWFDCGGNNGLYHTALRLHARRLLARDTALGRARRFTSTPEGDAAIEAHDDEIAARIERKGAP